MTRVMKEEKNSETKEDDILESNSLVQENQTGQDFEVDHTSLNQETYYDHENFIGVSGEKYSKEEWFLPVFKDGPSRGQVEIWKNTYGDIFMVPITDKIYVVRVLRRGEYARIREERTSEIKTEEAIVRSCLLHPKEYLDSPSEETEAGVPTSLSDVIYEKSGFVIRTLPQKL